MTNNKRVALLKKAGPSRYLPSARCLAKAEKRSREIVSYTANCVNVAVKNKLLGMFYRPVRTCSEEQTVGHVLQTCPHMV